MWSADDFINEHLLSMLGAPDFIGRAPCGALAQFSDLIDAVVSPALNPLRNLKDEVMDFAKEKIKDAPGGALGMPVSRWSSCSTTRAPEWTSSRSSWRYRHGRAVPAR